MKQFLLSLLALTFMATNAFGNSGEDFLRSTGKIYAVVAVIVVMFVGIAIFLILLDNKLTKVENQIRNE